MIFASRTSRRLSSTLAAASAAVLGLPAAQAADPLPRTQEELVQKRARIGPGANMFGAGSWAQSTKPKPVAAPPAFVPPLPPALPFTYGGSGVVNGRTILFLEQPHRSVMVEPGDTVDGAYRVEALEPNRVLLRYLPLDVVQAMAFGGGGLAQPAVPAIPPLARGPLFVNLPDEVPLGAELPMALGIPPGSAAAKATIELSYDAEVLSLSGARIVRPGKALVEVNAQASTPSQRVHLKAIAEESVQTEIGIQVSAFDAQGRSVEVRGIPAQHIITLNSAN